MSGTTERQAQLSPDVKDAISKLWELVNTSIKTIDESTKKRQEYEESNTQLLGELQNFRYNNQRLKEDKDLYEQMSLDLERQIVDLKDTRKKMDDQFGLYDKDISLLKKIELENDTLRTKTEELELKIQSSSELRGKLDGALELNNKLQAQNLELRRQIMEVDKLREDHDFSQKEITRRNFQIHDNLETIAQQKEKIAELNSEIYKLKSASYEKLNLSSELKELRQKLAAAESAKTLIETDLTGLSEKFSRQMEYLISENLNLKEINKTQSTALLDTTQHIANLENLKEINRTQAITLEEYSNQILNLRIYNNDAQKTIEELSQRVEKSAKDFQAGLEESRQINSELLLLRELKMKHENELAAREYEIIELSSKLETLESEKQEFISRSDNEVTELNNKISAIAAQRDLLFADNSEKSEAAIALGEQLKIKENENHELFEISLALEEDLKNLKYEKSQLEAGLSEQVIVISGKDVEIKRLQDDLSAKLDSISDKDDEIRRLQDDLSAKLDSISSKDDEIKRLQDDLSAKLDSISSKDDEIKRLQDDLSAKLDSISSKDDEIRRLMAKLSEDSEILFAKDSTLNRLTEEISVLQLAQLGAEKENQSLNLRLGNSEMTISSNAAEINERNKEITALKDQVDRSNNKIFALAGEKDELEQELNRALELGNTLSANLESIAKLEQENEILSAKISEYSAKAEKIELQMDMKDEQVKQLESQLEFILNQKYGNDEKKAQLIGAIEDYLQILNRKMNYD